MISVHSPSPVPPPPCPHHLQVGDRFRMYFGGKLGTKVGGSWYKGVIHTLHAQHAATDPNYDPWEAITVDWDTNDGSSQTKVCVCGGGGGGVVVCLPGGYEWRACPQTGFRVRWLGSVSAGRLPCTMFT